MGEGDDDAFPPAPDVAPWAHHGLREEAAVFGSASQNAWVLTEGWVEHALFCPNCGAQPMARFAADRRPPLIPAEAGTQV